MAEVVLTEKNFDQVVLQSELPVLVDFWATWCGPCRMLAPAVAAIAEEQVGKVVVGKVNVDEAPELARRYHISSIPTIMVFKNGQLVNQSIGLTSKEHLESLLIG